MPEVIKALVEVGSNHGLWVFAVYVKDVGFVLGPVGSSGEV